ncbi:MAG: protein kinase [Pirellulaceae bacterium]
MNLSSTNSNNTPPAPDLTGQELGDYIILRRLGSGGMAHVYLAEQKSLGRKVALKIMRPDLNNDETYVKRFVREARSAAALSQSNIVQIYEVGQFENKHYIAQEYVAGRNLKQYLSRHGAVEVVMAVNVLRQVGMALQKASEEGVIHRDIKPENVMINSSGEIKVADFGLARANNEKSKLNLTQVGITLGTPLYMSPEQIEGRDVDQRSDLYSLGVTVFHILAGDPPFDGETALAVAMKHINHAPPDLCKIRPDVPQALADLIYRLMAKSPDDRFQDASSMLRDLRKLKIDFEEDWASLAAKIAEGNDHEPADSQSMLAATRQLQTVLQGQFQPNWFDTRFASILAVLMTLAAALGIAIAWSKPVPEPLAMSEQIIQREGTPKKSSVQEQFRAAFWDDATDPTSAIEAYKSVIEYFPASATDFDTLLYHRRAKQRLGEIGLEINTPKSIGDAENYFHDLSLVDDPYFQAVGWAGLACVYHEFGLNNLVREELERLESPSPTLMANPISCCSVKICMIASWNYSRNIRIPRNNPI